MSSKDFVNNSVSDHYLDGNSSKSVLMLASTVLVALLMVCPGEASAKAGSGKSFGSVKVLSKSKSLPKSQSVISSVTKVGNVTTGGINHFNLFVGGMNLVQVATLDEEKINQIAAAQFAAVKGDEGKNILPLLHPTYRRINTIVDKLREAAIKDNPELKFWKWETIVINSNIVNAWCMPGGKIAFYTGLIDTLGLSDEEIAVVAGHEIEHAILKHGLKRMKLELAANGGIYLFGAKYGGAVPVGLVGKYFMNMGYSRENERQSDHYGFLLAAKAGYDPNKGIKLFDKFHQFKGGDGKTSWFSSHPGDLERFENMKKDLPLAESLYKQSVWKSGNYNLIK